MAHCQSVFNDLKNGHCQLLYQKRRKKLSKSTLLVLHVVNNMLLLGTTFCVEQVWM